MAEARTFFGSAMRAPIVEEVPTGQLAFFSASNPMADYANEDSAALVELGDKLLIVVADGAGGTPEGGSASRTAIETLARTLEGASIEDLRPAVLDGMEAADLAVQEIGSGSLTTLIALEVQRFNARSYNVGDSVALGLSNRGRVKLQTVSHSPVGYAVEAGLLDEREALHHDERHLVSNMVGTGEMRIDVGPMRELSKRDTLIVGSDGLFDNLTVDEIVEITRKGPLEDAATALQEVAQARMTTPIEGLPSKPDDLTFMIHRYQ